MNFKEFHNYLRKNKDGVDTIDVEENEKNMADVHIKFKKDFGIISANIRIDLDGD